MKINLSVEIFHKLLKNFTPWIGIETVVIERFKFQVEYDFFADRPAFQCVSLPLKKKK